MTIRLNKLLAQRGIGARRKCDAIIQSGAVRVNGRVVTEPGTQIEPGRDRVEVSGRPLAQEARPRYFALNKPVGVISTLHDPEGRRTLRDLMPPGSRVFPVGRLDADTSGLLILTNDGTLAHHLMHPRYGVEKVYRARLDRVPDAGQIERLRRGVEFEPGFTSAPARVRVRAFEDGGGGIEIALHEGRYRQVRRMCEAVGLSVIRLHRVAYGPLRLGPLERGMCRELSEHEVRMLRVASARPRPRPPGLRVGGRPARPGRGRPAWPAPSALPETRRDRPAPGPRERARPRLESGRSETPRARRAGDRETRPPRLAPERREARPARRDPARAQVPRPRFGSGRGKAARPRFESDRGETPRPRFESDRGKAERPRFGSGRGKAARPRFEPDRGETPRSRFGSGRGKATRPRFESGRGKAARPRFESGRGETPRPRFGSGRGKAARPRFEPDRGEMPRQRPARDRGGAARARPPAGRSGSGARGAAARGTAGQGRSRTGAPNQGGRREARGRAKVARRSAGGRAPARRGRSGRRSG